MSHNPEWVSFKKSVTEKGFTYKTWPALMRVKDLTIIQPVLLHVPPPSEECLSLLRLHRANALHPQPSLIHYLQCTALTWWLWAVLYVTTHYTRHKLFFCEPVSLTDVHRLYICLSTVQSQIYSELFTMFSKMSSDHYFCTLYRIKNFEQSLFWLC